MSSVSSLITKQFVVAIICHGIAIGILAYGAYEFYLEQLVVPELTRSLAVAVFFIGMGLEPNVFFTPLSQVMIQVDDKSPKAKLQTLVFNLGVFLLICSFLMEWLYD
ncbi:hypothetical protein [Shewanella putrefaciens]|uniref:Uncharacterized protein n=2 Tax=Shewanella putrefaciens TaxID=24 RepID=E6XJF7_SHEP2|nr:hypothetical protein [Shewanella putrefaciens]AVV84643.1 hypothetical protein SPWS13_2903 [Shewanella putrefaciens]MCA1896946.1 hypothetical protein [Shewanella putrefaciens]MCT8943935.1 hypothetical protein [Shewanella putrefaciens]MDR6965005.1 hypothetical protein [Shewanella putrefaciens]QSE49360.1 hypothetical protein JW975_18970 [Shewanella putrefaciens]